MLRLFLLTLILTLNLRITSAYWTPCSCSRDSPLIPGASVIIGGFDMTELATSDDRSFKSPIFDYSGKYSCLKPGSQAICYIVPAELNILNTDISKTLQVEDLFDTYYDHVEVFSESYTCSVGIGVPDFSMSVNYHYELLTSSELLQSGFSNMGYAYYAEYLYSLNMPPAYTLKLNFIFGTALNALPSTIESIDDQNMYNEFLLAYGGYYISTLIMGGGFHMNQYVDQSYISSYSFTETIEEMQAGFNAQIFNMNFGYWSNSSEYTQSDSYTESSTESLTCYGGDISLECGSNEWKMTITKFPSSLNATVIPIYYLVKDNQQKYITLKGEIDSYTKCGCLPSSS